MIFLECKIDTTDLMRAQAVFFEYGKTVPALALNRTVLFITKAAQQASPSTGLARIDSELAVEVAPRIGKRGNPLKSGKDYKVVGLGKRNPSREFHPTVELAWLIIGARAKPGSNYNTKTSNRYAIRGGHPFKGQKRSQFRYIMQDHVNRMVKQRHRGSGFFMQSWGAIIAKLIPHVPASYRSGFGSLIGRKTNPALGWVQPAVPGPTPVCIIELRLGMQGKYPALDSQRNQAMHTILGPILQTAISSEYQSKMEEAARRGWIDRAPQLRRLGFDVGV